MSYYDLSPDARARFLELQAAGLRSPATIREHERDYPASPTAARARARALLAALSANDAALVAQLGSRWAPGRGAGSVQVK